MWRTSAGDGGAFSNTSRMTARRRVSRDMASSSALRAVALALAASRFCCSCTRPRAKVCHMKPSARYFASCARKSSS